MGDIIATKGVKYVFQAEYSDLRSGIRDVMAELSKLKKEIAGIGTELKTSFKAFKTETDMAVTSVKRLGSATKDAVSDMKDGLQSVASVAAGVTATLTTLVAAPAKFFGDFEAALNDFRAKSEASAKDVDKFKQVALETGEASKYTATQAALAGVELVKLGKSATEASALLPSVVKGADATGSSLDAVSKTLVSVMNAYKMETAESINVLDQIITVANKSATDVEQMAISFSYASGMAANSNQSFTNLAAALGLISKNGIPASMAGNHLQNMFERMATKPREAANVIEQFGLELETAEGKLKPWPEIIEELQTKFEGLTDQQINANLKRLFGDVAMPSALALFRSTNAEIEEFIGFVENAAGATDRAAKIQRQGLNYEFEQFLGTIQTLAIEIGEQLAPTLIGLLKIGQDMTKWLSELSPLTKSVIGHVLLLAAAFTSLILVVSGFTLASTTLANGLVDLAAGFKLLTGINVAAWLSTTALAAKGLLATFAPWLAALAALYFAYQTNFAGIKDIIDGFMAFIEPALKDLTGWFSKAGREIGFAFQGAYDNLKIIFGGIEDLVRGTIKTMGSSMAIIGFAVRGQFKEAAEAAKMALEGMGDMAKSVPKIILPGIQADPNKYGSQSLDELKANAKALRDQTWEKIGKGSQDATGFVYRTVKDKDEEKKAIKDAEDAALKAAQKMIDAEETRHKERMNNLDAEHEKAKGHAEDEMIDLSQAMTKGVKTSPYGMRVHPKTGAYQMHTGVDTANAAGTPIIARAPGTIAFAGDFGGYGKAILIDHGNGNYSLHGHNSALYKKMGDTVKRGESIAAMGSTGFSTGPHEHFEQRKGREGLRGDDVKNLTKPIRPGSISVSNEGKIAIEHEKAVNSELKTHEMMLEKIRAQIGKNANASKAMEVIESELTKARLASGKQQTEIIKAQNDYEKEMLKQRQNDYEEYLKDIVSNYEEIGKKAESFNENLRESNNKFLKEQEQAGMTSAQIQASESLQNVLLTQNEINKAIEKELFLIDEIESIKEANKGTKINKDIQEQLNKLTEKQLFFTKQRKELQDEFNKQIDVEATIMAQSDFDEYWKKYTDGLVKAQEKVDNLLKDPEALQNFSLDLQAGKITLDGFFNGVELTEKQLDALARAMADVDFTNWEAGVKRTEDATKELEKQNKETFDNIIGYVKDGIAAFSDLTSEMGSSMKMMVTWANTMTNVIVRGVSGDVAGAITSFVSGAISMVKQAMGAQSETQKFAKEIVNKIAQADAEILRMKQENHKRLVEQENQSYAQRIKNANDAAKLERDVAMNKANELNRIAFKAMQTEVEQAKAHGVNAVYARQAYADKVIEIQKQLDLDIADIQKKLNQIPNQLEAETNAALVAQSEGMVQKWEENRNKWFELQDEMAAKAKEAASKTGDYWDKQNREGAITVTTKDFLNRFSGPLDEFQANEVLRPMMESAARDWANIYEEVVNSFSDSAERETEIKRRQIKFEQQLYQKSADEIAKYLQGKKKESDELQKKSAEDLEKIFKERMATIKKMREDQLKSEVAPMESIIKAENERLRVIDAQVKAKEKLKEQDLAAFDQQDLAIFNQLMGQVDFAAMERKALADVHNPDGVKTETYSNETRRKAIQDRIELMRLENENQLGLEKISLGQFQVLEKDRLAFQARAAQELLKQDGLTTRERAEIQGDWKDAYVEFQRLTTDAITEAADAEIEAEEKKRDAHEATIEHQKELIDGLRAAAEKDYDIIEKTIMRVTEANKVLTGSFNEMIDAAVKAFKSGNLAPSLAMVGISPKIESSATKWGPYQVSSTDGRYYKTTPDMEKALGDKYVGSFGDGGFVPPGFPNDSGFARVTSGEYIGPLPSTEVYNVTVTGNYFKSDIDVKRAFTALLRDVKGSRANSSYVGSLT